MKTLIFAILFSLPAFAATDSIMVYHRPEKIIVHFTERGTNLRIHQILKAWGVEHQLNWQTADENFRLVCGGSNFSATCTIRILPSDKVRIEEKEAFYELAWTDPATMPKDFHVEFEGSRGHRLELSFDQGVLRSYSRRP